MSDRSSFLRRGAALTALVAALGGTSGAVAQGTDDAIFGLDPVGTTPAPNNIEARFTLGLGASLTPDYFGSDDVSFGPAGTLRFDFIRLPNGFEYGSSGVVGFVEGFGPRGSIRYIPSRKASDNRELRGLENVDGALELGVGLGYEAQYWRGFADLRYGFIGHDDFAGEFGLDAILRPRDGLLVNFGPRAAWGGSDFMDTYFGVPDDSTFNGGGEGFEASSGFYSVGLELGARYAISEAWGVEGRATYDRLINDASDSPITELGSEHQLGARVLITRSISLGF